MFLLVLYFEPLVVVRFGMYFHSHSPTLGSNPHARSPVIELDAWIAPLDAAIATAFKVMLEESLYWATVSARWLNYDNFWG